MNTIINDYETYLKNRKKSDNTIRSYISEIERFFEWIGRFKALGNKKITYKMVSSITWLDIEDKYLGALDVSNSTYNNKHSALKMFYSYSMKRGFVTENPMDRIDKQRVASKQPTFLTEEEISRLFEVLTNNQDENRIRDLTMIRLMLESGVRVSEISALKKSNVVGNQLNIVDSKYNKSRTTFISNKTRELLNSYLKTRSDGSEYLFIGSRGQNTNMSTENIRKLLKKYITLAGIEKNVTPHKLRHSFATHYYKQTKDIKRLQMLLGHTVSSTTDIYTHVVENMEEEVIEKGLFD